MTEMEQDKLKERFTAAVNSFVEKVRDDPNVIAVIVGGSFAYDMVWEKSDIDMTIIVRDQVLKNENYCIVEDGITINAGLMQRSAFKRGMEGSIGGSFAQSYFSKGIIVYTSDDSLYEYYEDIRTIGSDDMALSLVYMAAELIAQMDKCKKWLVARQDPLYAQYYLLKAAESIAHMEVCLNGITVGRDCIQKALKLNPDILHPLYTDAMSHHMGAEEIRNKINLIDSYLENRMEVFKKPILEFLSDQQMKTMTLISKHFHVETHFIIEVCDYLAEKGVIEKVSQMIRITPKSKPSVEEIGYLYIP